VKVAAQEAKPGADAQLIGFVGVFPTEDGDGYLGAALVTDQKGYPLEFRVSSAVRPTGVQRALFGQSLAPYVESELIGGRLAKELRRRPAAVLVNRLALVEAEAGCPVYFVARASEYVHADRPEYSYRRVERGDEPAMAIALVSERRFASHSEVLEVVEIAAARFDLVDTFDRLRTAISVLAESDRRYA
jgi:hypothetical protein